MNVEEISSAIQYISGHPSGQMTIDFSGQQKPLDFQRILGDWAGVTPSQVHAVLDQNNLKARFADFTKSKTGSPFPGFHLRFEGMDPKSFNALANKEEMTYGIFDGPFGKTLIAMVNGAVCHIDFLDDELKGQEQLQQGYPGWTIIKNQQKCQKIQDKLFVVKPKGVAEIRLLAVGTAFQLDVWKALLHIPFGRLSCYEDLARKLRAQPEASRAVGTAIGRNTIGWLVPCHRAVHKDGSLGNYKWQKSRKILMVTWEHLMC